jgi:salicylate hydroxylase
MDKHLSISVVGGGIGGLAVATALAQSGMQVTVLEQAAQIAEVGAGLQVSPNGLRVLRALGLEERLSQHSSQGQAVSLRRAESDYEVARLDLNRLPSDQRYHFVHRADLIDLLYIAALEADVIVKLAQSVVAIEPGVPATVRFANGTSNRAVFYRPSCLARSGF